MSTTQHATVQHPVDTKAAKAAHAEAKKEIHENQMHDPDQPLGTRAKAAAKVPGDKMQEAGHKPTTHYGVDHGHHPVSAQPGYVHPASGPATHGTTGVPPVGPATYGTYNPPGVVNHPTTAPGTEGHPAHYGVHQPITNYGTGHQAQLQPATANPVAHGTHGTHGAHGVHGDPTQYSVHPHPTTGVAHPSGVGYVEGGKVHDPIHNPKIGEVGHKHQPATHIGDDTIGSTTFAGHPTHPTTTTTTHPPVTKTPPPTPEAGTKKMEASIKAKEAEVKKEVHKHQAGDSNQPMGERVKAAVKVPVDAVQAKVAERRAEKEDK